MRTLALIALLLLLPFVQASMLTVQVVVDQDTPSIGATVSLITGGVALSTQRADQSGSVTFNVSDGTYFIDVNKSVIYPEYVVLKVVSGDSSMRIVRRQLINYANVYGQATGPSNFANSSVAAYQNGQIVQRTALNKDGFYMLQFLPEGTYELRFDSPGFETNSVQVFLPTSQFTPVSVALQAPAPPAEPQTTLSSPAQVPQFSIIEVSLAKGGAPLSGKGISVTTPSGTIIATTDAQGIARVNAAVGGAYRFSYGNLSSSTSVASTEPPKPAQNESGQQAENATQNNTQTTQPSQPSGQQGGSSMLIPALAALGIFGLVILAVIAILAARFMSKGRKTGESGAQHESHAHEEGHEGEGPAHSHGEAHHHPHEHGEAHSHAHQHDGAHQHLHQHGEKPQHKRK